MTLKNGWRAAARSAAMFGALVIIAGCSDASSPVETGPHAGFLYSGGSEFGMQIYGIRSDGSGRRRQFTDTPGFNVFPEWSPDGANIAFLSSRDGIRQLWLMNAAGSGQMRLTSPEEHGLLTGPVGWSPDGARLVLVCRNQDLTENVCVIGVSGGEMRRLLPDGWREIQPAWSPDGGVIAFAGRAPGTSTVKRLWKIAPDGGTPVPFSETVPFGAEAEPAWSPDGLWIAFQGERPRSESESWRPEIFIMRADGTERRPLFAQRNLEEWSTDPAWSRDGERIAFVRHGDASVLYIASADGSTASPIYSPSHGIGGLSWLEREP